MLSGAAAALPAGWRVAPSSAREAKMLSGAILVRRVWAAYRLVLACAGGNLADLLGYTSAAWRGSR